MYYYGWKYTTIIRKHSRVYHDVVRNTTIIRKYSRVYHDVVGNTTIIRKGMNVNEYCRA